MRSVSVTPFPDELPTRPAPPTTGRMLVFADRIARLAELAHERLTVGPDDDALQAAIGDLLQIQDLCAEFTR